MFSGSMCAVVTPFRGGELDEAAFARLIEYQITNGTTGIIPCGTTGESATLSHEEHERVIELAVKVSAGRVPVIAGTGSNSTREAIRLTKAARDSGADAALLITPYYNKPTQDGLFAHYSAVADAVDIPQVLYNVPARTGVNITPATVARLAEHPNIAAIKEAGGSMDYVSQLRLLSDLPILSGNDNLTLPLIALGAVGAISVLANVAPSYCSRMFDAAVSGDWELARELHYETFPLVDLLFCETNPIPVKAALAMMGLIDGEIRLPMTPLSEGNAPRLKKELERLGLMQAGSN
ncbi:4-hydroxy-tetrahydrodipicolinate synthase [candidate division BRC1 bacterium HGW-BRC1-1]|nr:MAG: 4-hydroxy-tetrahydrodipicolinate synthase [candidate division BRC1 bacterium HGW-BRC1-1]